MLQMLALVGLPSLRGRDGFKGKGGILEKLQAKSSLDPFFSFLFSVESNVWFFCGVGWGGSLASFDW